MTAPNALLEAALSYAARGWPVIPLHTADGRGGGTCGPDCSAPGKRPRIATGADHAAGSTDPDQIRLWWAKWADANIGIVTGARSGLVILDCDPRNGGDETLRQLLALHGALPETVVSLTGGGGTHTFFRHPGGEVRVKTAGVGVDIKADGGYIVAPPSLHASGRRYEFEVTAYPEAVAVGPPPAWLLTLLTAKPEPPRGERTRSGGANTSQVLRRARGYLRAFPQAVQGEHGDAQTYQAACVAVRGFNLSDADALDVLREWNAKNVPPWADRDLEEKVEHARKYGKGEFGYLVQRTLVLIPGRHQNLVDGKTSLFDVRENDFADAVIDAIPPGQLYRRGNAIGTIAGDPGALKFEVIDKDAVVLLISKFCDLASQTVVDDEDKAEQGPDGQLVPRAAGTVTPKVVYPFALVSLFHAGIVIAAAKQHPRIRRLNFIATYPVYSEAFVLSAPGWNEASGIYFDATPAVAELKPLAIRADAAGRGLAARKLAELVVDFPFKNEASRQNFYLLLLTTLLRVACNGNSPWFFATATLERTGKSKLIDEVCGILILGHLAEGLQLKERNEETEKDITTLMIEGAIVVNFDNVRHYVDSASLASLLTRRVWSGRILGLSKRFVGPNNMVVCGTGNQFSATGEIAKRVVPIELQSKTDRPQDRTDFVHTDLPAYLTGVRPEVLGLLLGMIEEWRRAGRPQGARPFGGFEGLMRAAGGVLDLFGFTEYMSNQDAWLGNSDAETGEIRTFVDGWAALPNPERPRTASELIDIVRALDIFPAILAKVAAVQVAMLGRGVLVKLVDRPVGPWIVRRSKSGTTSLYHLEALPEPDPKATKDAKADSAPHDRRKSEEDEGDAGVRGSGDPSEPSDPSPQADAPAAGWQQEVI